MALLHACLTLLCASGSTRRRCPESVSITGTPVLTLTVLSRIKLSHIPTYHSHKLSPKWISSFLSCCCASRLKLPPGLTPFSICQSFCTANENRRTSPPGFLFFWFFFTLFPCFICPAPLTCLALVCSAEITLTVTVAWVNLHLSRKKVC